MAADKTELTKVRLDLADTRAFAQPGAGARRRDALAGFGRDWLAGLWAEATDNEAIPGVALAAIGSLARREAGPLSDYDLVLLHDGRSRSASAIDALANRLWYPIWDAGVRLDHSVRTVNQCRTVASGDLSAAIGLLDLCLVTGDPEVVAAARATVAHDWRAGARQRLPDLVSSLGVRHARQGELAHCLEPDLKEAHGGLRDMSILRALTAAWLADRPHGDVDAAHSLLLDVRDALHVVTGRGRDRLGREEQDSVAALLGYATSDDLLTEVSRSGRTIAYALDGTVRRASQSQRARAPRIGPRRPEMAPLGWGLYASDGEVVLGAQSWLERDPLVPLRAAVVAARARLPIAPVTLTNLATRAPHVSEPWPELARDLFTDLLASGPGLVLVWEGLDQAGIIDQWLPEWSALRSRPQRNAVHRHTVDRHLVEAAVHAAGLVRSVARPDLLLMAALFHDVGKLPNAHDHSVAGAPIAEAAMLRMGFAAKDAATVRRLVREHLTLVELATRRDASDPATIAAAIDAAGHDLGTYDLLLALTEADATATGPTAWTDWRAALIRQLDAGVRASLRPSGLPDAAAPAAVAEPGGLSGPVRSAMARGEAHVEVHGEGGSWRVDVCDADRLGLFADTAGLMASQGLLVRSAVLRTVEGVAVDEWHVESPTGTEPDAAGLVRGLRRLAAGDRSVLGRLDRRRHGQVRSGSSTYGVPGQARAFLVPGGSADSTVLEVRADDRRGLLHDVGAAFARAGVSVRSAHIATHAGQTLDTFYLTDAARAPLGPAETARLVGLVIDTCEGGTSG